jgi:hypothetical protein
MKAGKEHSVPLSDGAIEILRDQLKGKGKNPHVFPGARPTKPLTINAFGMVMGRMGEDVFVPHGFRASFRSWCADQGVAFEVAESALAHTSSSVVEAYQRGGSLPAERHAGAPPSGDAGLGQLSERRVWQGVAVPGGAGADMNRRGTSEIAGNAGDRDPLNGGSAGVAPRSRSALS